MCLYACVGELQTHRLDRGQCVSVQKALQDKSNKSGGFISTVPTECEVGVKCTHRCQV